MKYVHYYILAFSPPLCVCDGKEISTTGTIRTVRKRKNPHRISESSFPSPAARGTMRRLVAWRRRRRRRRGGLGRANQMHERKKPLPAFGWIRVGTFLFPLICKSVAWPSAGRSSRRRLSCAPSTCFVHLLRAKSEHQGQGSRTCAPSDVRRGFLYEQKCDNGRLSPGAPYSPL